MWFFKKKKKNYYEALAKKWTDRHKHIQENLWFKHGGIVGNFIHNTEQLAIGTLAGLTLLMSPGNIAQLGTASAKMQQFQDLHNTSGFILDLLQYLPNQVQPLSQVEGDKITQFLSQRMGFRVTTMLDGIQLNTNYGYIGQEQHLALYPGDSMASHIETGGGTQQDLDLYYSYGMAPGLGAWGYFAPSQSQLTQQDILNEKYYIAVQTFLSPGYNENVAVDNKFFRYRKVLVVNPDNGRALVADIGDAGPSSWTGKSLGGSPEVMHYLQRVDGAQKGPVLYFFVDDPNNTIPLGPVNYTK